MIVQYGFFDCSVKGVKGRYCCRIDEKNSIGNITLVEIEYIKKTKIVLILYLPNSRDDEDYIPSKGCRFEFKRDEHGNYISKKWIPCNPN